MSDNTVATYRLYVSAWSRISDQEREDRLARSVAPDVVFRNPHKIRYGRPGVIEQIKSFQSNTSGGSFSTPGGSFRVNWVIGFGNDFLAEWQLVDASGKDSFNGYDAFTLNEEGLIKTIVLWDNTKEFRLA